MRTKKAFAFLLVLSMMGLILAGCGPSTTEPTAEEPAAEVGLEGKKVCYLIPTTANPFLSGLTEGVKEMFAADGVEVLIFGAEEDAQTQFNQIENCISTGVDGMIIMAALEPEGVESAVLEAKAAGIKVMGVPVDEQGPYDAIMHADQFEIGKLEADMACDWINATFPDAADGSVEVAVIGTKGTEQIKKRTEGMETIADCAKANLVQYVDVPEVQIAEGVTAAENIFTAHPDVKVILVTSDGGAQGVAEAMLAYAPDNLDEYAVYSGDVSPDTQEALPKCELAPYRGAVSIGGTLEGLIESTYKIMKGMIGDGDFPAETLDPLTTFVCEAAAAEPAAEEPAADVASEVVMAIGADPANLGPFVGMSMGRISVLNTMYAYLFYVDPETGSLDPYLAESLENTAEKTYVVTLFDYITDSDGNPITAADVAFSYNTAMEANVYRPLGDVESVTATGDYTVEFVTKEVQGPGGIEKIVTECPIVSQVAYEASDDDFATMPTTPAAYVLTEYVPGSSLTFERRADYWQTDPSLSPVVATANVQKAVFQIITEPAQHTVALQTGSADVSTAIPGSDIALFDGDPDYTVFKRLDNLTTVLVFNGSEGNPFTSKELRQAVAYAIDTTAMCAAVSPGACNPASAIGNANFEGYLEKWEDESYYDYDLAKAQDLLEAAGFQPGDLTVKLLGQNDPRTGLVAQVVQAALAELGINVEISQVEPPVFQSDKADPTKWDIVIDATAGGDFIFSPWQLIFDQKRYNGTTSGWVKDDQLQALMDTAAAEDTFTPENVDAAWQYIKDTVYAYGLFSNVNNTVSVSGITEVFHDHRGFVLPGVCEYAPDF